jgi:hypothetical protein
MVLRRFGRFIYGAFDRYPFAANSVVGAGVYATAEVFAQLSVGDKSSRIDTERVSPIAALGAFEVGGLMSIWYRMLDRAIGASTATPVLLSKCAVDQLFFATQGDALFIALCAYQDASDLPSAIVEVRKTFVTTWINDCAVWPLVNFLGFAALPTVLLPTYMAMMMLFWQLYMSLSTQNTSGSQSRLSLSPSIVMGAACCEATRSISGAAAVAALVVPVDDDALEASFREFDRDDNGVIDADELRAALSARGILASEREVREMIRVADVHVPDGAVNLAEFKAIARASGDAARLWKAAIARKTHLLEKGSKHAYWRFVQFEQARARLVRSDTAPDASLSPHESASAFETLCALCDAFASECAALLDALQGECEFAADPEWQRERAEAIRNCSVGLGLLGASVAARRVLFRV